MFYKVFFSLSMVLYLNEMKRPSVFVFFQMPRNERFSTDFQYKLETLIETITPYITSKYKDAPRETKNANFSLAYFVKVLLVFCLSESVYTEG